MKSTLNRPALYSFIVVLLAACVYLQHVIDRPDMRHEFEPKVVNVSNAVQQLPIEFALGAAMGFREAIAGLLWVRTDEFFDQGDYDAIIPMVRIITWLDPHDIDVYETGAWHMDYNFTDQFQRSDRRYIPVSLALMKEGIENNPDELSLYADMAFTHQIRKVEDYPQAVYWYEQGLKHVTPADSNYDVTILGHGLAHAYEYAGDQDKAIDQWKWCVKQHQEELNSNPSVFSVKADLQSALKNLNESIWRRKWRKTMVNPPINVDFDVTMTRVAPYTFEVTGHANFIGSKKFVLETGKHEFGPVDGCRVEMRLQDSSFKFPASQAFGLGRQFDPNTTLFQDQISIKKGKFAKRIDFSKDVGGSEPVYPFKSGSYKVTFWINPTNSEDVPVFVGDRIGLLGQGLATNQPNIDTRGDLPGTPSTGDQPTDSIKGLHLIEKTITLNQDAVAGSGIADFH